MAVARARPTSNVGILRRETHPHDVFVDGVVERVLADPTRATYARFLATVYQFEYAVELQLAQCHQLPISFLETCMTTGALGDDLLAVGIDGAVMDVLAQPLEVAPFSSASEALGWAYVLRHHHGRYGALSHALGLRRSSRYLDTCAAQAHARWLELEVELDYVVVVVGHAGEVVDAAREAFAVHRRWCEEVSQLTAAR